MKGLLLVLLLALLSVAVLAHEEAGVVEHVMGEHFERRSREFQKKCSLRDNACVLQHQATQGPYYLQENLVRSNIKESQVGVPLTLRIRFRDVNTCQPVVNAAIDIWHCNATGVYSGVDIPGNHGGTTTTFLRGTTFTDADGYATFQTIFPGYYEGRPTHIHYKVHLGGSTTTNVIFTGQTFFTEDLVTQVNNLAPYNTNPVYRVQLVDDAIYNVQSTSLAQMSVTLANAAAGVAGGLVGTLDFGVDTAYTGAVLPDPSPAAGFSGHPPCIATLSANKASQWSDGARSYAQFDLSVLNDGPPICPVIELVAFYNNTLVTVQSQWNLDSQPFTLGSALSKPGYKFNQYGQALNPGNSISGYGAIVSWDPTQTSGDPVWRLGHVSCGGICANNYHVFVPTSTTGAPSGPSYCSTVSFASALVNSWNTASATDAGSQWSVVLRNTGSATVTFITFSTTQYSKISSIWNVNNNGNGVFSLPSSVMSLAPGASISFGYVVNQASALAFSVSQITCSN